MSWRPLASFRDARIPKLDHLRRAAPRRPPRPADVLAAGARHRPRLAARLALRGTGPRPHHPLLRVADGRHARHLAGGPAALARRRRSRGVRRRPPPRRRRPAPRRGRPARRRLRPAARPRRGGGRCVLRRVLLRAHDGRRVQRRPHRRAGARRGHARAPGARRGVVGVAGARLPRLRRPARRPAPRRRVRPRRRGLRPAAGPPGPLPRQAQPAPDAGQPQGDVRRMARPLDHVGGGRGRGRPRLPGRDRAGRARLGRVAGRRAGGAASGQPVAVAPAGRSPRRAAGDHHDDG